MKRSMLDELNETKKKKKKKDRNSLTITVNKTFLYRNFNLYKY